METISNGKSSITINQLLVAVLGIIVPVIGYLGNGAISDIKSQLQVTQTRQREMEEKVAKNSGQLEQFSERIISIRAAIDERGARTGNVESMVIAQGERISRLEAQQDRSSKR